MTRSNESVMSRDWLFELGTIQPDICVSSEIEERYVQLCK